MENTSQRSKFQQTGYNKKNTDNRSWFHVRFHFSIQFILWFLSAKVGFMIYPSKYLGYTAWVCDERSRIWDKMYKKWRAGANYSLYFCTFANVWTKVTKKPSAFVSSVLLSWFWRLLSSSPSDSKLGNGNPIFICYVFLCWVCSAVSSQRSFCDT